MSGSRIFQLRLFPVPKSTFKQQFSSVEIIQNFKSAPNTPIAMLNSKTLVMLAAATVVVADNYSTYPQVPKTASINGFADPIYSVIPECAQACVKQDTGSTPCPYWDAGCLCVMSNWSGPVAQCVAQNCHGQDVSSFTSAAISECSSVGAPSPYWFINGDASAALASAATASPQATTTSEPTTTNAPTTESAPVSTDAETSQPATTGQTTSENAEPTTPGSTTGNPQSSENADNAAAVSSDVSVSASSSKAGASGAESSASSSAKGKSTNANSSLSATASVQTQSSEGNGANYAISLFAVAAAIVAAI